MYERSIIVLEKYLNRILEFEKKNNLKKNFKNFSDLLIEIEEFQRVTAEEIKIIEEFDITVQEIESIQKQQSKLVQENRKLEEVRYSLFIDLGEDAKNIEVKLKGIEKVLEKNNEELIELRKEFIDHLNNFGDRQKQRNKCEKARRITEANHIKYIKNAVEEFQSIDVQDYKNLKDFYNSNKETIKQEIFDIMIKNGRNEKVKFDESVIKKVIKVRMDIAEREIESYLLAYDKTKKILLEVENDNLKLDRYNKIDKDISSKFDFLESQKEYLASFLDYERMTSISGPKAHKISMEEASANFELDIMQINNLYELLIREMTYKSTKKAYDELYNTTYLKNIEDKEKNFEEEINAINTKVATVVNSNYWRIEGIRNIYEVFNQIVSEKYGKDLSEYEEKEIEEYQFAYNETIEDDTEELMISKDISSSLDVEDIDDNYSKDEKDEYEISLDEILEKADKYATKNMITNRINSEKENIESEETEIINIEEKLEEDLKMIDSYIENYDFGKNNTKNIKEDENDSENDEDFIINLEDIQEKNLKKVEEAEENDDEEDENENEEYDEDDIEKMLEEARKKGKNQKKTPTYFKKGKGKREAKQDNGIFNKLFGA